MAISGDFMIALPLVLKSQTSVDGGREDMSAGLSVKGFGHVWRLQNYTIFRET